MASISGRPIIKWQVMTKALIVALFFGISNAAQAAGELVTPTLQVGTALTTASCRILNTDCPDHLIQSYRRC
jgi:hypothetical protein